ncbi:MAG: hypothetical protein AABZ55_05270, partial [Bdellovibrionota bacterium]
MAHLLESLIEKPVFNFSTVLQLILGLAFFSHEGLAVDSGTTDPIQIRDHSNPIQNKTDVPVTTPAA